MKILINHWNSVLYRVHDELERRGHEVLVGIEYILNPPKDLVAALFWNETMMKCEPKPWGEYVKDFKKKGIKTFLYQHGRFGTSRIFPPFNEPLICDKVLLWGEADRKRYESVGTPSDRIVVTGCPLFMSLKSRIKQKKTTIVFCPEHWGDEVEENFAVAQELRKLKKVNIITKLLKDNHYIEWYDNPVLTDRNSPDHFEITADVLSKADVVVGVYSSTFELMAQYLDIPVIVVDTWRPKACSGDEKYKTYRREKSNGVTYVTVDKLNDAIKFYLKRPEYMQAERSHAVIEDGGAQYADPLKNICDAIEHESL